MPPSGTRSSSKSSGAGRSRGFGKSSGGNGSGNKSYSSAPKSNLRRGPTGPKGESRTNVNSQSLRGNKGPGLRGPTGPNQERRAPVGRNAPTGRRGPLGPQGEPRSPVKSPVRGFGKRFGPLSNDVQDIRKMQGPPRPPTVEDINNEYGRRTRDIMNRYNRDIVSDLAGTRSKTGAQYGANRAMLQDKLNKARSAEVKKDVIRNVNVDRSLDPTRDTAGFRKQVSAMVPKTTLPSKMNLAEKIGSGYRRARNAFGNALYGPPPDEGDDSLFRRGGLVKKSKRKKK